MKIAASSLSLSIACGLLAGVMACGAKQNKSDGSLKTVAPIADMAKDQDEVICMAPGVELGSNGEYICDDAVSNCSYNGPAALQEIAAKSCTIVYGSIMLTRVNGPESDTVKSNYPTEPALTDLDTLYTLREVRNYQWPDGRRGHGGTLALLANDFLTDYDGISQLQEVRHFVTHFSSTTTPSALNLSLKKAELIEVRSTPESGLKELSLGFQNVSNIHIIETTIEKVYFTAPTPVFIGRILSIRGNPNLVQMPSITRISPDSFHQYLLEDPFVQVVKIRSNPRLCQPEAVSKELWVERFPFMVFHYDDGTPFEILAKNCSI